MVDAVRVALDTGCRGIDLDGRTYEAHDGHVTVVGSHAEELRRVANTLPARMWHLGGSGAAEVRCAGCGRRRLALFGPRCAWCGTVTEG